MSSIDILHTPIAMNKKNHVSIKKILDRVEVTHQGLQNFTIDGYDQYKKIIKDIGEDIELALIESEERYQERLKRRPELEVKRLEQLRDHNREKIKERIIKKTFVKKDNRYFIRPVENKKFKESDLEEGYAPIHDYYTLAVAKLKQEGDVIIKQLEIALSEAKSKCKDMYEEYSHPEELFKNVGIGFKKKQYDLLAEPNGKDRYGSQGPRGISMPSPEEMPTFKKIGYIIKNIKNTTLPSNYQVFLDPKGRIYIYLLEKNISIIVSDITCNNKFKDATYIVRGPILSDSPLTKEALGGMQGKRIIYTDGRARRVDEILDENPSSRSKLQEPNEEEAPTKTLITDKIEFVKIIKENFTLDTLDSTRYMEFIKQYNARPDTKYLLRETLQGNTSLLGIPAQAKTLSIKKNIFENKECTIRDTNKKSFRNDENIKKSIQRLISFADFLPNEHLGVVRYESWILSLLKIGFDTNDAEIIKKKSQEERKAMLKKITGADVPLYSRTLTFWLGGYVGSNNRQYQELLRSKFCCLEKKTTDTMEYRALVKQIAEYENNRIQEETYVKSKIPEKNDKTKKNETKEDTKKIEEKKETVGETEKKLSFDDMHYKLHNAQIVGEIKENFRILKIPGYDKEIRLYKRSFGSDISVGMGSHISVFAVHDFDKFTKVLIEKYHGYHTVIKFYTENKKSINDFVPGDTYTGVINNINDNQHYMRVSLTDKHSGRIKIPTDHTYNIGSKINVMFNGQNEKRADRLKLSLIETAKEQVKQEKGKLNDIKLGTFYTAVVEGKENKFRVLKVQDIDAKLLLYPEDYHGKDIKVGQTMKVKPFTKIEQKNACRVFGMDR